jgi:hypothetical protein
MRLFIPSGSMGGPKAMPDKPYMNLVMFQSMPQPDRIVKHDSSPQILVDNSPSVMHDG